MNIFQRLFEKKSIPATGKLGEDAAAAFLRKKGYRILKQNYRSGKNEIDIIAQEREFIVFIEVKTRTQSIEAQSPWGRPARAVNAHKRRCLVTAAKNYVRRGEPGCRYRFDVIEVYLAKNKRIEKIHHIERAFIAETIY